jgi:mono/diheme cytochrome c family protein
MKPNLRIAASLAGLVWLSTLNPHSLARSPLEVPPTQSSTRGGSVFRKSCSVCHSIRAGETKVGPSLYGVLRQGSGHSEQTVRQIVAAGTANMPGFQQKLEPEQMDDLIEYLKTL